MEIPTNPPTHQLTNHDHLPKWGSYFSPPTYPLILLYADELTRQLVHLVANDHWEIRVSPPCANGLIFNLLILCALPQLALLLAESPNARKNHGSRKEEKKSNANWHVYWERVDWLLHFNVYLLGPLFHAGE